VVTVHISVLIILVLRYPGGDTDLMSRFSFWRSSLGHLVFLSQNIHDHLDKDKPVGPILIRVIGAAVLDAVLGHA
jgi:hypothetical protein